MNDLTLLGPWVRRFLLEHLVAERNLARNTQRSYRDALTLLIPFVAGKLHQSVDRLTVIDVSADLVRLFLDRSGAVPELFDCHPQPALGGDSCSGSLRGRAQSGAHCLVWSDSFHSLQKGQQGSHSLSGQTGDGRAVRRPGPSNRPRPPRPRTAAVSLQLRSARPGSRTVAYQRTRFGRLLGENPRQRWQRAAMSSVAEHR